jgi:hypothetical protein
MAVAVLVVPERVEMKRRAQFEKILLRGRDLKAWEKNISFLHGDPN